ncbi:MAG: DUF4330 family protein [Clostridia bacterium]|nr:DUF4330 family protein [Clostridia bacterium]
MADQNKKRFRFNIVDVIIVLVVAVVIGAAYMKFNKYNVKTDESSQENIVYNISIYNVRDYSADAYRSGDAIFDSLTGVNIGVIENVTMADAVTYETTENGKLVKVTNPYKKDVVLTVKTPGTVEANAYYANKSIELKVNSQKTIETKYAKTTGTISSIAIESGDELK